MGVSDHYQGGMTERLIVAIVTVDPSSNRIEGVGKDAAVIQISVGPLPPLFRWPKQDEYWTIERVNGQWQLGSLVENPDSLSVSDIQPGEVMIQGDKVWTSTGRGVVTHPTMSNGQGLLWNGTGWVATDLATQTELDSAVTSLNTSISTLSSTLTTDVSDIDTRLDALEAADVLRVRAQASPTIVTGSVPQLATAFPFTTAPGAALTGRTSWWRSLDSAIIIPTSGWYMCGFEFAWGTESATGTRDALLAINGGTRVCEDRQLGSTAYNVWLSGHKAWNFVAGDALQLYVSQSSGGNMTCAIASGNIPSMYLAWLGL